jgi:hypothetical protein
MYSNIDWLSSSCPLKKKLRTVTRACNLIQVDQSTYQGNLISQTTRVITNCTGIKSSTYIDHIFSNAAAICFKSVSKSIRCSDHNLVAISRKTKVPKDGSYNKFCSDSYVVDIKNICWSVVCNDQPDAALIYENDSSY